MLTIRKDTLCGLFLALIAMSFVWMATGYEIGTARRMGPGFFPMLAGILLAIIGLSIAIVDQVSAARSDAPSQEGDDDPSPVAWLPLVLILSSVFFFGATVSGLGLVPALLLTVFVSALSGENTWRQALVVSILVTALCAVVFKFALGLKAPLLGPWLALHIGG